MKQLEESVEKAQELLATQRVPNERAVDSAIVQPILAALGWDAAQIDEMYPEYSVGGGRVDWALCEDEEPCLFLEEKAPDQALSAHEEQLLQYSFAQGIPLAVLTNGNEWWLYLPLEEGNWSARKFAVVDLEKQPTDEACQVLEAYLDKKAVWSGRAKDIARDKFAEARERQRIRDELPGVIQELLVSPSEFITEVFQTEAQTELGALPGKELVKDVLREIALEGGEGPIDQKVPDNLKVAVNNLPPTYKKPTQMALGATPCDVSTWKDVLVHTAKWLLGQNKPLPLDKKRGRKWVLVSKSPKKLTEPREIADDIYVGTNYSARDCVRHALWLLEQAGMPRDILKLDWE